RHQCLSIALNIAESTLHRKGACRLHGSGYTGTIQAFVPYDALNQFKMNMERVFGIGSCKVLTVRPVGGCEVLL
ncbi:MAG: galactokinase, partial [Oscillospiraceae bacterium]|nr:galactokinase [Oscillospiraceae bacterium]